MALACYRRFGKRAIDVAAAVVLLIGLSPLLLTIGVLSRIFQGPGVFFRQRRPGWHGQPFFILKFRTMRGGEESDAKRLTRFGGVLRATSLDELPELFNVLAGDMSLVGPRPLIMEYLDRYTPEQARRHHIRPGITGWTQVSGRNALSWEQKFERDVWYVDHYGFWLDIKILILTLFTVLSREGISAEGHATMPEFLPARGTERH